jgi:uncharacterized protein YdhG (YjbR/CyaY superfamily)
LTAKPETPAQRIARLRAAVNAVAPEAMDKPEWGGVLDKLTGQLNALGRAASQGD